jgi:hypothetical protein
MILIHESTLDLADQDASVIPGGAAYLHDLERRPAPYFERTEPRQRAMADLRGLLSPAERKYSWQLVEVSGDATPYAFQHLLRRARWDPEAVRDELRRDVLQHLGDPEVVLVIAETGVLNKGRHSAGVARQYSGTAAWTMGRLGCCWAMPVGSARPGWTANFTCPKNGPTIPPAGSRRGSRRIVGSRPHRRGPSTGGSGRSRPACPAAGAPATAATGMTGGCACGGKPSPGRLCWRSRAKQTSGAAGSHGRSTPSWPRCRRTAGHECAPAMVPKVCAGMTGSGGCWLIP